MSIYDLVVAREIAAWWEETADTREMLIGEELFPSERSDTLEISWILGADETPVVLLPSAYDAQVIPMPRIGFSELKASLPFFKSSKYIDETLRRRLLEVINTARQTVVDMIMKRIFNDETQLLVSARVQRERMRMSALCTGVIAINANGQSYEYNYGIPNTHKVEVAKSWSDATADILGEIRTGIDTIQTEKGVKITRAITSSKVFGYLRKNNDIKESINYKTEGKGFISDSEIKTFISDALGLEIVTNDLQYKDESGTKQRYVPEDVFVMFPSGELGKTYMGITPEEADLLYSTTDIANVEIVDEGVAITTMVKADPVNVETKVSQVCLPSFPMAGAVFIYDVVKA